MKLAIMQPYLFPYIGYFQLAAAVDRFVFYDDVNFIKNGWINRNRVLLAGRSHYLTVPLKGATSSQHIDAVCVQPQERWLSKLMALLHHAYSRAPQYLPVSRMVERVLATKTESISQLAARSVVETCAYLGIETAFVPTSSSYGNDTLKGQARVVDICRIEHATAYINLPGGRALYDAAAFSDAGVKLAFVEPALLPYAQFGAPFVAGLSIVDALMFQRAESVRSMLVAQAEVA